MITTSLPPASMAGAGERPATYRFDSTRCSMARWTPASRRPGVSGMSRPFSAPQAGEGDRGTHVDPRAELHPLGRQLDQPPVERLLLELEVRDAVPHEAADGVVPLVHG